jgi:hypothetical protein
MPAGRKPKDCPELIRALACGASPEAAAQKAGVSARTVYRRLADPAFRAAVGRERAELVDRAVGMSAAGTLASIKRLTVLQDAANSEAVQASAARSLIDAHCKLRQVAEQQARLEALEAQLRQLLELLPGPANKTEAG